MSESTFLRPPGVLAPERLIDTLCDRFEAAWKKGTPPPLEDFVGEAPEGARALLLRELVLLDIAYRLAFGGDVRPAEYLERFPGLEEGWLASAIARERAQLAHGTHTEGPEITLPSPPPRPERPPGAPPPTLPHQPHQGQQIRCPHCHNPILLGDGKSDEVLCPGCGSRFLVWDARQTGSFTPMRLGKFQLLERVGLGAFGAVWRALDTELDRVVALKVSHAGQAITPAELERVYDEGRKAAQLRHPGIVTVHEVATLNGLPVLVSDFIQGVPLSDLLKARPLTFRESAALVAEIADALDYAHARGVVHRDIKPANLIVEPGPDIGVPGLGRPLILDFGLALREQGSVTLTLDGQLVGTPAYMSPEQAAGKGHHADRRSDIFSLGVVLYELLTRELPFRGARMMVLLQVQHEEPRPPRGVNDKVPRDLETICLKCMNKEPGKRYQTARELGDDLRRFLRGEAVLARPIGRLERAWRWGQRHPGPAALTGAIFLLLALLASGATLAAIRIERERERAERERLRAEGHFDKTLLMVDLLTRVAQEALENTPQMEESQLELLQRAQGQLTELLDDRPRDQDVRRKLALVYQGLGEIWRKHERADLALDAFTRAAGAFHDLAEDYPDQQTFCLFRGSMCQNEMGEALRRTSPAQARGYYDRALEVQKDLVARFPQLAHARELARTENNVGLLVFESGQVEQAEGFLDEALGHLLGLPDEPEVRAGRAQVLINRGNVYFRQKRLGEAGQDYERAIALLEGLRDRHPGKHDYQYKLGTVYNNLGELRRQCRRYEEALTACDKARAEFTRLAGNFPRYPLYRKELAQTYNSLGRVLAEWKPPPAAVAASAVGARALGGQPHSPVALLAGSLARPGVKEAFLKAQPLYEALAKDPGLPEYRSLAGSNLHNLAILTLRERHPAEARTLVERAITLQTSALDSNRRNPDFLRNLAGHHVLLTHILVQQGQPFEAARRLARQAGALGEDPRLPRSERRGQADRLARRAVEVLRGMGPALSTHRAELEAHEDWIALRPLPEFQELLRTLRSGGL